MTSESIDRSIASEPKKRDYQNALAQVKTYIGLQGTPAPYRDVGVIVIKALTGLVEDVPDPFFYPFEKGTIFYKNWAYGFSALPIFHAQTAESVDMESQVFWLFNFVYAFRLEATYRSQGLTDLDVAILSIPQRTQFPHFAFAQLELMRAKVAVTFAVDSQSEIRHSLRGETEASLTRLEGLAKSIKTWEEKLSYWEDKTADLEKLIKQQHQELNFIGLSSAFLRLIEKRTIELTQASRSVKLLGAVSIAAPVLAFLLGILLHTGMKFDWSVLSYGIPAITVELLLLYFFRISLRNEYSLKAQLLQLELRYNICAFIESYADFAKKTRADDSDRTLEKFEALVFSGVTADIQNIPSQFDGVEQLVSLIKSIKAKD
ncbi:hypothetical protein [Herbaspirillum huttiense]|uniref:Uncharacterized protein n=2 Tax=Herbaspirillum huttiense TaxID=863372 RepID=A0AAJ2LPS6_9BURK|nr:hypothetical protein [Herbaspirillum huttiense]MDR9835007.1 hypothetical protein [Herbaspirillum huttiense]